MTRSVTVSWTSKSYDAPAGTIVSGFYVTLGSMSQTVAPDASSAVFSTAEEGSLAITVQAVDSVSNPVGPAATGNISIAPSTPPTVSVNIADVITATVA